MTDQYQARNIAEISELSNELQTMRSELQEIKSMAQELANQEQQNYQTLTTTDNKTVDMRQMTFGEKQASKLLEHIGDLVSQMNQRVDSISSQMGVVVNYQPKENFSWEQAAMINGGQPLQQGANNDNEYRIDPPARVYPYDRSTT